RGPGRNPRAGPAARRRGRPPAARLRSGPWRRGGPRAPEARQPRRGRPDTSSGLRRERGPGPKPRRRHGHLAEGDPSGVGRDLARAEHAESGGLQPLAGAGEEEAVLKAATAEDDVTEAGFGPRQMAAGLDGAREGFVEASGGDRGGRPRGDVGRQRPDGGTKVDLEGRAGANLEGIGVDRRGGGHTFQLGGRLSVVAHLLPDAEHCRHRVEPAAGAGGGGEGLAALEPGGEGGEGALGRFRQDLFGNSGVDGGGERQPPGVADRGAAATEGERPKVAEAPVRFVTRREEFSAP